MNNIRFLEDSVSFNIDDRNFLLQPTVQKDFKTEIMSSKNDYSSLVTKSLVDIQKRFVYTVVSENEIFEIDIYKKIDEHSLKTGFLEKTHYLDWYVSKSQMSNNFKYLKIHFLSKIVSFSFFMKKFNIDKLYFIIPITVKEVDNYSLNVEHLENRYGFIKDTIPNEISLLRKSHILSLHKDVLESIFKKYFSITS